MLPPDEPSPSSPSPRVTIAERNLEDFVVQQLDAVEPGLRLVQRQLSTEAGRLDLFCQDAQGGYVVVELKRLRGSDQVVGQTLRYMGWARETYPGKRVRGIVIVGKIDEQLRYAVKAASDIQVKVFTLSIE